MENFNYLLVFSLMFLENIIIPIPSELILLYAGYLVSIGKMNFVLVLLIATVASLLSSLLAYAVAFLLGKTEITKFLKKIRVKEKDLRNAEKFFRRKGKVAVFLARLIPGLRSLISYPAGFFKMSLTEFTIYTFLGTLLWNTLLIFTGYVLGSSWQEALNIFEKMKYPALIIGLIIFILLYKMFLKKKKN